MTLYIVMYSDPSPPHSSGIAGVFNNRDDAKRLVDQFKHHHASITEWPLNFGDVPKVEIEEREYWAFLHDE